METCNCGTNHAVLDAQTTGEGWKPYSLDTLVLRMLLYVLKTTDEVWDPY